MSTEWSNTTKHIVGIGLALFALYLLYISRSVLTFVIMAALIAFLLMPVVKFLHQQLKLPRVVAVLLAYVLLTIIILLAPLLLLPPIIDGFRVIADIDYQILVNNILQWLEETLLNLSSVRTEILGFSIDLSGIVAPALNVLQNADSTGAVTLPSLGTVINSLRSAVTITYGVATSVAGTLLSGTLGLILTLLYAIYMSLDAHKFAGYFLSTVPKPYRPEVAKLLSRLSRIWRAYFRGQLTLMIIIGVVTWLGNTVIGLPGAFALAVIAGVMELIPNLGPFLAAVPAVVIALIQGSITLDVSHLTFALIVIGFYIAVQQFENHLIVPRVIGEAVELHPLVVMVGVVVGASVAGILGALLAAPMIASGREVVSYLYAKILGQDPFPPQEEKPVETKLSWLEQSRIALTRLQEQFLRLRSLPRISKEARPKASQEIEK